MIRGGGGGSIWSRGDQRACIIEDRWGYVALYPYNCMAR